ncbi:nicotinate-nucleotide--dimethylbenzimidazole phosphoribosyltransferase [Paenibacillus sp. ACRRX]|uniref:nicotinate-nucleotide--dimethylbenzimidazole phosphoribosyltransferase n=1 Tax=unclassified Paenibacillus TaxID=185978 RepID=UPI001EF6AA4D|nr:MULTISPECIES: nicotinate-nucleotide--dimethylbenzimidazole phosphoribosyltransferase [unclassified Paenibacillus]MCG7409976.1 nicotinate-nucleotide--dimethylbenzimidazole phosphoribosyltransferase [Paenibacillus sp. ACRRX]MDK8182959.1 nicotinate-nucleotide--dimethylbenzimidazole phosphoribosyltransferase [Paenibacillus sp. UMB4589-SE434]
MTQQWSNVIPNLNEEARQAALNHQNQLTKPPGSLGVLEQLSLQLAAITGETVPQLDKKAVIVMAGDHGVCEEGVSAFPAEVTPQMVLNFIHGGAAVNVLAREAGAQVVCVDVGVNAELNHPNLVSRKVRYGTSNMVKEAAMSREEALAAIQAGVDTVEELVQQGVRLFATGEMGIGNTTASAAILCAFTGMAPEDAVGRGTGIGDEQWQHKCNVVRRALEFNQPKAEDALDVLAKVGGLEIAGLVGVILGAARHRAPIVIDGFISSAAALTAVRLAPEVHGYLIGSHLSDERGHRALLQELRLQAPLHLNMRLGEGTGAVILFQLIDAACRVMREMATFAQAGVSGQEDVK